MVPPYEDLIACHVLGEILHDSRAGKLKPLEHYQRRYPDYAKTIGDEWQELFSTGSMDDLPRQEPSLPVGSRFANMRIEGLLGRGGQGEVYRALDLRLSRQVAIKILHPLESLSAAARGRLEREGRLAARLDHPGICRVFESGMEQDTPYLIMELIEGTTLAQHLRELRKIDGPLPPEQTHRSLNMISDLAAALAHAHDQGIVHRDLKPSNVMLTPDCRVVLLDLGLSRTTRGGPDGITATGDVLGTLGYMAPERLSCGPSAKGRDTALDPAVDVYSLGVLMHETLAPKADPPPVQDGASPQLAPQIPTGLRAVISRCLQRNPGHRYQDAGELSTALQAYQESGYAPGTNAYRLRQWRQPFLAAAVIGIAVAALAWGLRSTPQESAEHNAELSRSAGLLRVKTALFAGDIAGAARELAQEPAWAKDGSGAWLAGALRTERQSLDRLRVPMGSATETAEPQGAHMAPSILGRCEIRAIRPPGRQGQELVVTYPGAETPGRNLSYPDREVRLVTPSADSLRVAVVALDPVDGQQYLDLWCGPSGILLERTPVGVDPVTASAELDATTWILGRHSGAAEVWQGGAWISSKEAGIGPIVSFYVPESSGAWAISGDGRERWIATSVARGARVIELGVPVRSLRFTGPGRATVALGRGWQASLDLNAGTLSALCRADTYEDIPPQVPAPWESLVEDDLLAFERLSVELGVTLYPDRLEFLEWPGAWAPLRLELPGRLSCLAFDEVSGLLLVGNFMGQVFAYRRAGWQEGGDLRPSDRSWLADARENGFVSRATIMAGSWEGLDYRAGVGDSGPNYLNSSSIIPCLPRAWYDYLARYHHDALRFHPMDHGMATRLAAIELRRGNMARLETLLTSPPLAESSSPAVGLLKGIFAFHANDMGTSKAFIDEADRALARGGGLAGPLFSWLRSEASSFTSAEDRAIWNWLATSVTEGLEDPESWRQNVLQQPVAGPRDELAVVRMEQHVAAARLLVPPLLPVLAAASAPSDLHHAAGSMAALASVVADGEAEEPFRDLLALAALRRGDPIAAERWIESPPGRGGPNGLAANSRVHLLIQALVCGRSGDMAAAASAFNRAATSSPGSPNTRLAAALLEDEVRRLLRGQ